MDNNKINEVSNIKSNVSYKKIVLIFGVTIIIILTLAILFYVNISKDTSRVIRASIKYVGDDYIIVTDKADEDYIIDVDDLDLDDECEVGDMLSLTIDKVNDNKDPIEAEAKNVKIITKAKKEEDEVVVEEKSVKDNSVSTNDSNNSNNADVSVNDAIGNESSNNNGSTNNQQSNNIVATDSDIVTYFNNVDKEIDRSSVSKTLSESAKNGFITVVDFLFYDKPIKGKTYKDLSNNVKLKVLELGIAIDKKIDSNFPGYKASLASKYQNVKSQAISKYLDKAAEVCSKNEDTCATAKEGLSELKQNFSITWSFIKDISGVGLSKLKAWYEIWRQS